MFNYLLVAVLIALQGLTVVSRSIEDYELFHITLLAVPGPLSTGETSQSSGNSTAETFVELLPKSMKMQYILGEAIKDNYQELFKTPNGELIKPWNLSLFNSGTPGTNRSSDSLAASLLSNTDYGLLEKITEYEGTSDRTCFPPFFGLKSSYQTPISPHHVHQQMRSLNNGNLDVGSPEFLQRKCPGFSDWLQQRLEEHQKSALGKIDTQQLEEELKAVGYDLPNRDGSTASTLRVLGTLYNSLAAQATHRGLLPANMGTGLMNRLKKMADISFSLQVLPMGPRGDRSKTGTHELALELLRGFEQSIHSSSNFRSIEFLTSTHPTPCNQSFTAQKQTHHLLINGQAPLVFALRCSTFAHRLISPFRSHVAGGLGFSMHRSSAVRAMHLSPLALHSLTTNLGLSSTETMSGSQFESITDCLLGLNSKKGEEVKCLEPPTYASNWVFEFYKLKNHQDAVFVRSRYNGELVDICGLDTGISKDLFCPYQLFRDIFKNTLMISRDWRTAPDILQDWGFCPNANN